MELFRPIKFSGIDADPKGTLQEALDALSDRYDVTFDVDVKAFAQDLDIQDVLACVVLEHAVPKDLNTRLVDIIQEVLNRISGCARIQLTEKSIFITTLPRISVTTDGSGGELPLRDVLDCIEDSVKVVIDREDIKSLEMKPVSVAAAKELHFGVLLERILRQVEAEPKYTSEGIVLAPKKK